MNNSHNKVRIFLKRIELKVIFVVEPVNSVGQNIDYDLIFQFDSEFQSVEYTD